MIMNYENKAIVKLFKGKLFKIKNDLALQLVADI